MALHGSIEVDGRSIGHWSARRTGEVNPEGSTRVFIYEATASVYGVTVRLDPVVHRPIDGPVSLAAKVLAAALVHLPTVEGEERRTPPTQRELGERLDEIIIDLHPDILKHS